MSHCCVVHCTNDSRKDGSLNFHRFPSDQLLKRKWIVAIRRDEGPCFKASELYNLQPIKLDPHRHLDIISIFIKVRFL